MSQVPRFQPSAMVSRLSTYFKFGFLVVLTLKPGVKSQAA